jgi:ComF family protein
MSTRLLTRLREDFLHLIAPNVCPGCDQLLAGDEAGYCFGCRSSLDPAPLPHELFSELATAFPDEELALSAIGALYAFEQGTVVQRLIHALKYQGCIGLGIEMGYELGGALTMFREFENTEMVVAVPLHKARSRQRGYNQAAAIARGVARRLGVREASDLLVRQRNTTSQTTLDASERKRNTHRAFVVKSQCVAGRTVMLCDDVCTTGATLNACAEALLEAGASRIVAATVARDLQQSGAIDDDVAWAFS